MEFNTRLVGVSFKGRQENLPKVVPDQELFWKHEADSRWDPNSVLVYADAEMTLELGHLNRRIAKNVVRRMQEGVAQKIFVNKVTGDAYPRRYGLNVRLVF